MPTREPGPVGRRLPTDSDKDSAPLLLPWEQPATDVPLPHNDEPELLTVAQVAARSGFSGRQVRRWIEDGALPAVRIGRGVRVHRDDWRAFWQARRRRSR